MDEKQRKTKNIIVKCGTDVFLPLMIMYGLYVIFHGDSGPGGGFQGGVLVAASVMLIYLGYGVKTMRKVFKSETLQKTEAFAEAIYVIIAFGGLIFGYTMAKNIIFNVGGIVTESASLMNDAVGLNVTTGIGVLLLLLLGVMNVNEEDEEESEEEE